MRFVAYQIETTLRLDNTMRGVHVSSYASESAAKVAISRACKANKKNPKHFAVAEYSEFYDFIEKKEIVPNLMTGIEVEQSVNTPLCCDVSSETYWSM